MCVLFICLPFTELCPVTVNFMSFIAVLPYFMYASSKCSLSLSLILLFFPPVDTFQSVQSHFLHLISSECFLFTLMFLFYLSLYLHSMTTFNLPHFLAESIVLNNSESKTSLLKTAIHGQYRRHSSHPSGTMEFAKPAMLKIGAATAVPIMLYQQWIHVQEPSQSDATDDTKGSDDDQKLPNKMSCEDTSLHISR